MRRTHEHCIGLAKEAYVVAVAPPSGDKSHIFLADNRPSDGLRHDGT